LGEISENEVDRFDTATKTLHAVFGYGKVRCAVRQILKSVVREIRTLRSVGVGAANWAVPSTRRSSGNGRPYRDWRSNVIIARVQYIALKQRLNYCEIRLSSTRKVRNS
jgi:hypothetical protein